MKKKALILLLSLLAAYAPIDNSKAQNNKNEQDSTKHEQIVPFKHGEDPDWRFNNLPKYFQSDTSGYSMSYKALEGWIPVDIHKELEEIYVKNNYIPPKKNRTLFGLFDFLFEDIDFIDELNQKRELNNKAHDIFNPEGYGHDSFINNEGFFYVTWSKSYGTSKEDHEKKIKEFFPKTYFEFSEKKNVESILIDSVRADKFNFEIEVFGEAKLFLNAKMARAYFNEHSYSFFMVYLAGSSEGYGYGNLKKLNSKVIDRYEKSFDDILKSIRFVSKKKMRDPCVPYDF